MPIRKDTIKEIKGLAPALAVEDGGTGGKTPSDARKGLGFEDLGFGVESQAALSVFDWQQFTFASGASYAVNPAAWSNPPAGVAFHSSITSVFVSVVGAVHNGTFELLVTPNTNNDANYKEFKVRVIGAKGLRTFSVRQIYSSADIIPLTSGGTGGKTAAEARANLELNVRVAGDKNINEIGPLQEGAWAQSSVLYAIPANNYPAVERGILEFFRGGRNNGTQQYTTEAGRVYIRSLSAAWNGTDGPWGEWLEVAGLSSSKALAAGLSLSDYTAFAQNTTYILSGTRDDLPAGITGNCTIMSVRRAGGTIAALNQLLFTSVGIYYRTGSPNTATNWTSINWYAGGDVNGWRLVGMEAMRSIGIGVDVSPLITAFDWQQADFIVGSLQVAQFGGFKNAPEGLTYNSTTSVTIETLQARTPLVVVKITPLTMTVGNKSEYIVMLSGAKGERIFQVTQVFNSDSPVPLSSGGHGGKNAAEARVNLELNTRGISDTKNINEIGPLQEGRWAKTTITGATLANGYPEDNAVGTLDVFAGGSYGCTQIFTARSGIVYSRYLTANWNGKDGPWSTWISPKEDAPYPDVWAPLSDDLRLVAGFAPRDKVTIGDQTVELATKSMAFTRASTATYIDKMGVLQTAAVNEPRFERGGLLIEGHSTNNMLYSEDPTKWATYSTLDKQSIIDGKTQATTFKGTVNSATSSNHLVINSAGVPGVVGDVFTLSARIKATSNRIHMRFTLDGTAVQAFFDGVTGAFISASSGLTYTAIPQDDGYTYLSVTFKPETAGVVNGNIWFNGAASIPIGESIFVQTVQFEKNAVATSYIPTAAAAVTRAIENANIPAERNIGYRLVGDKFNRTLSFELAVDRYSPPSANFFDAVRGLNANNDIILRIMDTSLRSYRAGGGPIININAPFSSRTYVQTTDTTDRVSMFMDGKTDSGVGGPTTPATSASAINFAGHPNVVYHVRNFRIWHRLLSGSQVRGLR